MKTLSALGGSPYTRRIFAHPDPHGGLSGANAKYTALVTSAVPPGIAHLIDDQAFGACCTAEARKHGAPAPLAVKPAP